MNRSHWLLVLAFWTLSLAAVVGQKRILGDTREQKVSQVYDEDVREEKVYRRPPSYLIIASRIVRPSTVYQVVVSLLEVAKPMRVRAALSRDGVEVYGDHVNMNPTETRSILLLVPPGNNVDSNYRLRVEGAGIGGGAIIFENETILEFSRQFLSMSISTNKAIYNGEQEIMIRAVMLTTALHPYTGIADLFIVDPDGYVIRKWNSKELNNGVLTGSFQLPEYPKVGFWKIRVEAQGQVEEKAIKVEKYYIPKFEVYVRMPTFVLDTDKFIEAEVSAFHPYEKTDKGDVQLRWFAKKVDYTTPMYNDSVLYRNEYSYYHNISNTYRSNLYNTRDGIPLRNLSLISQPNRYGYIDPYLSSSNAPERPIFQNWTYIRSDRREFRQIYEREDPFYLYMSEIEAQLGSVHGVQVRAEAWLTEYFYNNTQRGFCETRIINQTLSLRFVGSNPLVFKPGMPFEGQIAVRYHDQVALATDKLESSTLLIKTTAKLENGQLVELPEVTVPQKLEGFSEFQDVDRLKHYGQSYGSEAQDDFMFDPNSEINPAAFFTDDVDKNTQFLMEMYAKEKSYQEYRTTGVHRIELEIPETTTELKMVAYYRDTDQGSAYAETTAYAAYAPLDRHIHIRSSNKKISVGEYVVFHVKSNFALQYFDWIIVSKNIILKNGREYANDIHAVVTTFSVVVSSEMAPGFHIIIYSVTADDYLLSDSAYYPVQAINRHKIQFSLNQVKDHLMHTVEATCRGDPGAVFLTSSVRQFNFATQGKNFITKASILESLHTFENDRRHIHRVFWTDREGTHPDEVTYFPSMDYGVDSNRTFGLKELLIFTDYLEVPQTRFTRQCNVTAGQYPCLIKGCYIEEEICDGQPNCEDGFDESNCGDSSEWQQEQTLRFRLSRFNRYVDYYDSGTGDWGWLTKNIDEDREQFYNLQIPMTTDDWYFNAFSISKDNGIGLLDDPVAFSSIRPVHSECEGPGEIHRGESIGIRCLIMNRSPYELETFAILKGSKDYKFIHVEEYGYVKSYAPRMSDGDHHHLVYVRGNSEKEVIIPVAPQVEQGLITVEIEISTQIMSITYKVNVKVLPEGSIVHRHTSVLLDLKSRANVLQFMNIIVDETPIIPYEIYRRYVSGSPYAHVTVCGDVIGPTFPGDEPVVLERMFTTGHGRFGKGTEYHAFNLAANTLQLHYYRLTNQLQPNWELAKRVFEAMNVEYSGVMRRFSSHGYVTNWDNSKPSVWLTAWVIRILQSVSFQDWEDYIYLDPMVIGSAVMWLLNYQTPEGAFTETEYYNNPLHKPMDGRSRFVDDYNTMRNISLTAHVLISLEVTAPNLQGDQKKFSATARQRAVKYLERHLAKIVDSYELAITAYALAVSGSAETELAYRKLQGARREEGGMLYWGRSPIKTNRVRYEFNRPFLEAKDYQDDDALAVEATGYALLTMFMVEGGGVTIEQDKIVQWLNTMRLGDGGFISTVDTIVAMEALVRYSYNSRIKDITDLQVEVDIPDSNMTHMFKIESENIAKMQRIDIPNVWGHINLVAHGAGQAIAQLDVNWGVDYEPFKDHPATDCFNLTIQEYFHGRNKSEITIKSCFGWTLTEESPTSGMAMLVVDIPSGYIILQPDANRIVNSKVIPEMQDADTTKHGKSIWYFDYIPNVMQCFEHTVRRYYPVANLTRTRQAVIVEPLRPERFFVRTFNATSLYILSICEVCGSYQCPYCPFYSHGPSLVAVNWAILLSVSVAVFLFNDLGLSSSLRGRGARRPEAGTQSVSPRSGL
ncbi:hypothetical protein TCAL_00656 [Tigriopus californicus]|uniref:CD109 antigen n=1 Tax=Tigriopus californicus TaxID=6832 RepID=A0A553P9Q6_TIGCA|nr:CD109 antigen-like [Tigriopus californicus]TRY74425.1 hypothetical protein TCAL_00656 [Tigriopus californicus]